MPTIRPGTALDTAARRRIAELVAFFARASARLEEVGRAIQGGPHQRRHLRARLLEAHEILERLIAIESGTATGDVVQWVREHFPATYGLGARRGLEALGAQAVTATAGDTRVHTAALEFLAQRYLDEVTQVVIQLEANVIRASRVVLQQAGFAEELAAGIIGGLPRRNVSREIARALRAAVTERLPKGAEVDLTHVEVDGRTYTIEYWAEMHTRTESARAATAGTRAISLANGVQHVQITSHAHEPCICTPFEGRIYSIHRGDERFPWIGTVPNGGVPMHPNCVHREVPAVIEFLEERGELEGRDVVPAAFRNLRDRELARAVRENRDRLAPYARDREGVLPVNFRLRTAA